MKKRNQRILTGLVKKHPDGFGFLIPHNKTQEDVYISKSQMQGVMSDDEIKVEVFSRRGRSYGRVLKVIQRTRDHVLGSFVRISKKLGCIKDENHFFGEDILFHYTEFPSLQEGDWLEVQILSYPGSKKGFQGKISKVLGSFPSALSDNMKTLREFNIPYSFKIPPEKNLSIQKKDLKNRQDLQSFPFVTIDGATAQDFDDAIYIQKKLEGWVVFVSIADVDFYVKEDSPLDQTAYQRGNSTYFPGFCSPMLPEYLSQDLCSLKPQTPRFTMTAEIHFDKKGFRKKSLFYESVIFSQARLTYGQAQEIIDGKIPKNISSSIVSSLSSGAELAQVLLKHRVKNGSLNLEIPETEIHLDKKGYPIDILPAQRLFSHQLIEELMLACNQAVAEFLSQKKIPCIYRIHDIPPAEDLNHLYSFLKTIDSSINFLPQNKLGQNSKLSLQKKLCQMIQKIKGHPKQFIMYNLILRTLTQACYSSYNRGHFGLSFSHYTHFTSPIRRYSDLIVHRILKQALGISKQTFLSKDELEIKAQLLSQCEQRSVKAERHIENIKKARFMENHLRDEFTGMIASVTKFGFFVTLKQFDVDGLIHLDSLGGRWLFDPSQLILRSRSSGYIFQQGEDVRIRVVHVSIEQGKIDFELLEHKGRVFRREKKKQYKKKKQHKKRNTKKHYNWKKNSKTNKKSRF